MLTAYNVKQNEYGRFEVIKHHGVVSEWRATFARKDHAELYAAMLQLQFDAEKPPPIEDTWDKYGK
jgi:hypothetical protein